MHNGTLILQREFEEIHHKINTQSAEIVELKIQRQKDKLLSQIKGSRELSRQINALMTTIQHQAYEKMETEAMIAIEAFIAKEHVLGALLKDCFDTFKEIRDSIPIPEIKIENIRETLTTILKSPKPLLANMYDARNTLFSSRFGKPFSEEDLINDSIQKLKDADPAVFQRDEVEKTFLKLFTKQYQEIDRVKRLFEDLNYGKYKDPIEMYFIKLYAVSFFKHHVAERQKHIRSKLKIAAKSLTPHPSQAKIKGYDKKGALIAIAQFIFKTLEIDWPYKATYISGTLSTKKTEVILKTVIEAESHLSESLEHALQTLLKEREVRPWSARENPDKKETFYNDVNTQRFSDALLNDRTTTAESLTRDEEKCDSDIEEVLEFEDEDESKQLFRNASTSLSTFKSRDKHNPRIKPCFFKTDSSVTQRGKLNQRSTHHIKRKL